MENNLYFKDETSKYIFFLVELGGKPQLDFLGVDFSIIAIKRRLKIGIAKLKISLKNQNIQK